MFATSTKGLFKTKLGQNSTPLIFIEDQKIPYLPFTENEFAELITSFSELYFKLDESIIQMLYVLCGRHPGLTRVSLIQISVLFKKGESYDNESDLTALLLRYIVNGNLAAKLIPDSRCFIRVEDIADELELELEEAYSLILMMLNGEVNYSGDSFFNSFNFLDKYSAEKLQRITNCYMFVTTEDSITFSCPLVCYYYRREWVKYKSKVTAPG